MNTCSDNHDEIVYTGRWCPVCSLMEDIEKADLQIQDLWKRIEESENGT